MSHANMIIPRLYLGDHVSATDEKWLKENNITVVFNCTKNHEFASSISHKYRVPIDDSLMEEDLKKLGYWSFEIVYKLLQEYKSGKSILVHCHAGRQRSAAVVAMFLLFLTKKPIDDVIKFIQSKRPIAFTPYPNFISSIMFYEKVLLER